MSPLIRRTVIALSVVVFAYVTSGYVLGRSSDDKAFRALTVYSEVLEHIQRDYVDEPNMHQVTCQRHLPWAPTGSKLFDAANPYHHFPWPSAI